MQYFLVVSIHKIFSIYIRNQRKMKNLGIVILISLLLGACNGNSKTDDTNKYSRTIVEQANEMGQLLMEKDFRSFARFTYPKIIEMMGGLENMVAIMEKGMVEMESDGTKFLNVTFGEPTAVIKAGNELQCTLSQTISMKVPEGRIVAKSTMIAISVDGGTNWFFIDSSGKDIQTLRSSIPDLSMDLLIPEAEQPVFYKD